MKYYNFENGKYPKKEPKNSENEFFGNGWSVKKDNNTCLLTYISGELQGRLKTIEILEEDYLLTINGKLGLDELCKKYNIY